MAAIRGIRPLALFAKPRIRRFRSRWFTSSLPNRDLELALYPPTRTLFRKSPVLVYIHGGSWKSGSHRLKSSELEGIFNPIRSLGIAVVSVQYRLTDSEIHFPAHLEDVTDALKFIVNQAPNHNLDANRIGLLGASAGAHLALLASSPTSRCAVSSASPRRSTWLTCLTTARQNESRSKSCWRTSWAGHTHKSPSCISKVRRSHASVPTGRPCSWRTAKKTSWCPSRRWTGFTGQLRMPA